MSQSLSSVNQLPTPLLITKKASNLHLIKYFFIYFEDVLWHVVLVTCNRDGKL